MWKRLVHPNIVPLLGITVTPPQLISDWMSGGDLPEYIKKNSDADRLGLVSVPLVLFYPRRLRLSPAIRRRSRPSLPPLSQRDPRGPQGSA